jgi:hypothetical protein
MRLEFIQGTFSPRLPSVPALAKSATVMALTYLAVEVISNVAKVDAGPISYAACIAACVPTALAGPGAVAACALACAPMAGPWCP